MNFLVFFDVETVDRIWYDGQRLKKERNIFTIIVQPINGKRDKLVDTYVDDGYTGTDFDRPGFIRMMEDVRTGKIQCIIVKDLSRFGRNFIETGYYIETIFPCLNVRLISINDEFDSSREEDRNSIVMPVKNMINEMYAKDASKKKVLAFEMQSKRGDATIARSIYGYTVDKKENQLKVNPETAPIVRAIFRGIRWDEEQEL